jgi:hypothetical protein
LALPRPPSRQRTVKTTAPSARFSVWTLNCPAGEIASPVLGPAGYRRPIAFELHGQARLAEGRREAGWMLEPAR